MSNIKKQTYIALLVAIAVIGSSFLWFPAGVAKAFPVQHAVNVIAGVLLGPVPAVIIAFLTGLIRNFMGTGSLLAFPGGMIGAFLAGYLYRKMKRTWAASAGEIIGSGLIAPLFAVPYAALLLGTSAGAFFYIPAFLVSSLSGALLGYLIVTRIKKSRAWKYDTDS
ncbi:energy coupling factor transporter S component ThiW [Evansella sp. LMS18]|uniref:energy coupling factor transporter S component ThiW n=1 Tax=Evansella sp. LMS18 TaxID=2924033 RepID=UPI0020D138DD|nr:energy coupling factor transporter S component ThiW [Evansella sp. LMS18]UTR09812.1 energy coupling factor transporter S component ThiW [Evansella sp. LMS18]